MIRDAEPLDESATARFSANIRRRYEELARFPERYLVSATPSAASTRFTVKACRWQSRVLDECLRQSGGNLSSRFFRQVSQVVDIPWSIVVGSDLRMAETVGKRTAAIRFVNWYMAKLHVAAQSDPAISLAFHLVGNLLAAPQTLLHPRTAWRVLRVSWHSRGHQPSVSKWQPAGITSE